MTPVGLKFPSQLTYEAWERAGLRISRLVNSSTWCLGDWLICGRANYRDRYQQAIEAAGLDYQTLRNYAWVARRFDFPRRRPGLSFQHHAEVARLPVAEQDHWLDLAEENGWSRNKLRERLRESRSHERTLGSVEKAMLPRLAVSNERLQRWQRAAEESHRSLLDWVIAALDEAAVIQLPDPEEAITDESA